MSKVTLTFCAGKDRRLTWVRKDEDYVADFCWSAAAIWMNLSTRFFAFTSCWAPTGNYAAGK